MPDHGHDGVNQYLYDGDGRICAVAQYVPVLGTFTYTGYLYDGVPVDRPSSTGQDAEGTRVAKGSLTAWSCDPALNGFQTTNDYVLGPGGEQAAEMGVDVSSGSANTLVWQHTNVWAAGALIATYDNDGLHFYFNDPLGTRRVQTDYAGVVEQKCQSLPFGDGESCGTTPTEHLFTGKERDTESGNDYFDARYYSSAMGRFMSPDWSAKEEPVPYAKLDNPQTLNLYAYVLNNPLSKDDPDGHSSLEYDAKTHTVTLYDKNGNTVGSWHANNRVDSHATLHGLPDGKYQFADTTKATHHSGVDKHGVPVESKKGEYGPFGIFHLKGFNADGTHHEGVGVHSGREDVPDASAQHGEGPDHVTQGCLRTTDAAMSQITDTAKTDPLTTLTVENNRQPQPQQPPPPPKQENKQ